MTDRIRAVIYTRTALEEQATIKLAHQHDECRRLCEARGWTIVAVIEDRAQICTSLKRDRLQQVLHLAREGEFDLLVTEALDRLSRDPDHIEEIYRHMMARDVQIMTVADGEVLPGHVNTSQLMTAFYREREAMKRRLRRSSQGHAADSAAKSRSTKAMSASNTRPQDQGDVR